LILANGQLSQRASVADGTFPNSSEANELKTWCEKVSDGSQ